MKRIIMLCCMCLVFSAQSVMAAGLYLASGSTISDMYNSKSDYFGVYVSGGTGPCVGNQWIIFLPSSFDDYNSTSSTSESYKRAYAAALMAFAGNYKVSIYNYNSEACNGASFIKLGK